MMDSYSVLTGKASYEEMLEKDDQTAFIFNPTLPVVSMQDDVFDVLIEYFSGIEDEMQEVIKEINGPSWKPFSKKINADEIQKKIEEQEQKNFNINEK